MKFPRNTRVFRGQLDAAAAASVCFLLAMFLLLHSAVVFTPGVRLDLQPRTGPVRPTVYIDPKGEFHYQDGVLSEQGLARKLRDEAEKNRAPAVLVVQADPGAPREALEAVQALAGELGLQIDAPGTRIELPEAADLPGTANGSLIVAVNRNGQLFFENQMIREPELQTRLRGAAAQAGAPLTLILRMDRAVEMETLVRLSSMARAAGFKEVLVATRPPLAPQGTNGP